MRYPEKVHIQNILGQFKVDKRMLISILEKRWWQVLSNLIMVPSSKMNEVLKEIHSGTSGGYLGVTKTLERLKQRRYLIGCH